jgi:hypothetical protein
MISHLRGLAVRARQLVFSALGPTRWIGFVVVVAVGRQDD